MGVKPTIAESLEHLARLRPPRGGPPGRCAHPAVPAPGRRAEYGAAEALRAASHAAVLPAKRPALDRAEAALTATLGADAYASAFHDGQSLPLELIVQEAIAAAGGPPPDRPTPSGTVRSGHGSGSRVDAS